MHEGTCDWIDSCHLMRDQHDLLLYLICDLWSQTAI